MPYFANYCNQNRSTPFDFLVIFYSFCVYSLVPGGWHVMSHIKVSPFKEIIPTISDYLGFLATYVFYQIATNFITSFAQSNSTAFNFLVIFCSFCVYSLVPSTQKARPRMSSSKISA